MGLGPRHPLFRSLLLLHLRNRRDLCGRWLKCQKRTKRWPPDTAEVAEGPAAEMSGSFFVGPAGQSVTTCVDGCICIYLYAGTCAHIDIHVYRDVYMYIYVYTYIPVYTCRRNYIHTYLLDELR